MGDERAAGMAGASCGGTIVMASQGQIFSHKKHPMQRGWSMTHVGLSVRYSGPGNLSMQSTGQTAMHTSQPEQLSGLMTAFGRPFLGWAVVTAMSRLLA
jgi:hypothetical protein